MVCLRWFQEASRLRNTAVLLDFAFFSIVDIDLKIVIIQLGFHALLIYYSLFAFCVFSYITIMSVYTYIH